MSKFVILHKKKDTLNRSCCIMKVTKQTLQHLRKKVPLANTIHHSTFLYNQFKKLNLCKSFSNRVIGHLMSILSSIFISGYHGKTTDFAQNSSCHRTTIAHFLNSGKWDDTLLENTLKSSVVEIIYSEAQRTGKPVFCIVDDTIASKTKPSSQALHPIEDAYFHQSHLKGKQDYGHQAVAVMLSCNGIVLNYAFVLYNKSISKIDIVQSIAKELPKPPGMSYFLVTFGLCCITLLCYTLYYLFRCLIRFFLHINTALTLMLDPRHHSPVKNHMHQIGEKIGFDRFYGIVDMILLQCFFDLDHLRRVLYRT